MKYLYFSVLLTILFSSIMACGGGGSGSSADLNLSAQNCGNAFLNAEEACDDGNVNNSDGCNAHCAYEVGEAVCGNAVLENEECCDDGNNVSGDGCGANCTSEKSNHPPSAPALADEPRDGATWAPTRLYLSWDSSSDSDAGDQVSYDVYFVDTNGISPNAVPYKKGITNTHFIIQASTDNRPEFFPDSVSPIYLQANTTYTWKVCTRDKVGAQTCSPSRIFNTDDSVMGWWRFEDQNCSNVLAGPRANPDQTICDYSGKGNHGQSFPIGTMPILASPNYTLLGKGVEFDGQQNYVEVADSDQLNLSELSIASSYISRPSLITQRILTKLPPGEILDGYNLDLEVTLGKVRFEICNQSSTPMCSPAVRSHSDFLHNVIYRTIASYDGNNAKIFLNNILEADVNLSNKLVGINASPLIIGKRPNDYFLGSMFDLILYNKALSVSEVHNDYYVTH